MSTSNGVSPRVSTRSVPLKVTLVMDTPIWAGTESYVQTLALALRELSAEPNASPNGAAVEVTIAAPPGSPLWNRARAAGIATVGVARLHPWSLDTLQTLTRRLRRGATDIVHAHNGRTALFGALAVRLAGRGACVLTHHFIAPAHAESRGAIGRLKGAAHEQLAKSIAHHIAISDAVAEALMARGEVESEHLTVVRNGIEAPSGDAPAGEALALASGDALPPGDLNALPPELRAEIACIARLDKEKDLPTLVRAIQILRDERGGAAPRCVVAGEGIERGMLEALIREHDLSAVLHLAGFTPLARQLMQAAQVCVLPSVAEPFGLALVEAMAQKRAVVAIDAGGPREIVVPGQTGILVAPGDASAMARALGELLDHPERARAMGVAGFERYQHHFTSGRMAQETLAVYQDVMARA